jgi:hypothetical protein
MDAVFFLFYHRLPNFAAMFLISLAMQYVYLMEISYANKQYIHLYRYGDFIAALLLDMVLLGIILLPLIGYLRGY